MESSGIALLYFRLLHYKGWGVSFTPHQHLTPRKTRYLLYTRLGGPQGRSGQVRKISPHRDSILGPSSPLVFAIPTTLPGPLLTYLLNYLLTHCKQLCCHSVAVILTPVETKPIRINIHKRDNTKHSKHQYTYYQNSHTVVKTPHIHQTTHYKTI